MATKVTAPKVLSITARMQYERFINGTSSDKSKGFYWQVDSMARDIDHSLDQMNGRLAPTHESRRRDILASRDSYITVDEWDALVKFTDYGNAKNWNRGRNAEEMLYQYVVSLDLDDMSEQFKNWKETHERTDEAKVVCREVLGAVRVATTIDGAEAALTRLREYYVTLKAEAEVLQELIANS
jgi:hypothetical protein